LLPLKLYLNLSHILPQSTLIQQLRKECWPHYVIWDSFILIIIVNILQYILNSQINKPFNDLTYWLLWQLWTNIWNKLVLHLKLAFVLIGPGKRMNCKSLVCLWYKLSSCLRFNSRVRHILVWRIYFYRELRSLTRLKQYPIDLHVHNCTWNKHLYMLTYVSALLGSLIVQL